MNKKKEIIRTIRNFKRILKTGMLLGKRKILTKIANAEDGQNPTNPEKIVRMMSVVTGLRSNGTADISAR